MDLKENNKTIKMTIKNWRKKMKIIKLKLKNLIKIQKNMMTLKIN